MLLRIPIGRQPDADGNGKREVKAGAETRNVCTAMNVVGEAISREIARSEGAETLARLDVTGIAVAAAAPDLPVVTGEIQEIRGTLAVMIPMTATKEEERAVETVLLAGKMIVVIGTVMTKEERMIAAIDAKTETMTPILVTAVPIVAVAAETETAASVANATPAIGSAAETAATIAVMTLWTNQPEARTTKMSAALSRASILSTRKLKSR